MKTIQKAVAYITCREHLLVFRQPESPEAGIQVPAGTIEPDESPARAVLREAHEETGLDDLAIRTSLGTCDFQFERPSGQRERVRRHYFHLECHTADVTRRWIHLEQNPSEGLPDPIPFELYWVKYPEDVPPLSGYLDEMLAALPDDI
ncbi:MAG: NUDIX domain-containing protein [Candidatus Promineifilaceae bacterium]|nr:NUDIX domain-containing protein [Candidatus Promineifilaceae bacterium]